MSGRLMKDSHVVSALKGPPPPSSMLFARMNVSATTAVSIEAIETCRVRLNKRGTDSFLPGTARTVLSDMDQPRSLDACEALYAQPLHSHQQKAVNESR